ncbi:MAG: threonine--tRNA ligase [Clostridia bacterium]|nr:threonine--tRNA ligase [Clostridia bacterium]
MKITFSTGEVFEAENEISVYDAARELGIVSRAHIAAEVDGELVGMTHKISSDCEIKLLTFDDEGGKHVFRHTASHILAQAVKRLYPQVKLTIGPAIETGFYYDFDAPSHFSAEDISAIENEMSKIVKENYLIERFTLPRDEAKKLMQDRGEDYKILLINRIPEGEDISFYRQGEFVDLCAGPHLFSTGAVKAFKLTQCTGAYWEGNSDNKMLCRVYGIAFPAKDQMRDYLTKLEEARKNDHNKLGRELELFTTVDIIGQGLPILLPKGARIIQTLQRWIEDEEQKRGYLLTKTPFMAKRELYKLSGHWDHYLDGMFVLGDPDDYSKDCFALRPMTCPFQYQVFLNRQRSYRDLPMRLGETSTLFRNEDSGEMHGLIRVRQFTISEGHLILRPDQLEDEFRGCLELAKYCLTTVGLYDKCTFRFSQWDPKNREKYIGTEEMWDEAQGAMKKILEDLGVDYFVGVGEAAFYGPKLDIQYKNVFGKEDTLVTIQIDQMLAEQYDMYYIDENGQKVRPYIIHRTSLGCYERTLAYMIEEFGGAFPMWLSPTQVEVIPVGNDFNDYAKDVTDRLSAVGIRVHLDARNEKIGYKVREATMQKIPYMLVVGEREKENGTVSVRTRKGQDEGTKTVGEFISYALEEIASKKIK